MVVGDNENSIKGLAGIGVVIDVITIIIASIIIWNEVYEPVWYILAILLGGGFITFVKFELLYGFGSLVEDIAMVRRYDFDMRTKIYKMQQDIQSMNDTTSKMCSLLCSKEELKK